MTPDYRSNRPLMNLENNSSRNAQRQSLFRSIMRVAVLSSGGKDSTYAIWWALMKGWDVSMIVTVRVEANDSMMFQIDGTAIAGAQAAAAGIPWLPILDSNEEGVDSLEEGLKPFVYGSKWPRSSIWSNYDAHQAKWPSHWSCIKPIFARPTIPIQGIVTGALRSDYQRKRLDMMSNRLGIHSFSPLWHMPPLVHMNNLVKSGFDVRFTSVSADGIDSTWINRKLDDDSIQDLLTLESTYGINIDGEGGEFETTVLSSPWFNPLEWDVEINWNGRRGNVNILDVNNI
ncbi:MAG: diphthine--ammonia ligase [Euryarchaeota archaeon TMED85]|nr:MAG: diphthine--ammonia ligase [Euryarchaeota archaeon]RPG74065.1 MAG: diphthine--ammonia ligase [Euryarchaeota archaeon TMED85]